MIRKDYGGGVGLGFAKRSEDRGIIPSGWINQDIGSSVASPKQPIVQKIGIIRW